MKHGNNIFRIFFFTWIDQKLVMLHGFTKKTAKTLEV
ncbi:MAG: type II toxin-antitoxin system RelE/ParE family toxin [Bacilli bacterium]